MGVDRFTSACIGVALSATLLPATKGESGGLLGADEVRVDPRCNVGYLPCTGGDGHDDLLPVVDGAAQVVAVQLAEPSHHRPSEALIAEHQSVVTREASG